MAREAFWIDADSLVTFTLKNQDGAIVADAVVTAELRDLYGQVVPGAEALTGTYDVLTQKYLVRVPVLDLRDNERYTLLVTSVRGTLKSTASITRCAKAFAA